MPANTTQKRSSQQQSAGANAPTAWRTRATPNARGGRGPDLGPRRDGAAAPSLFRQTEPDNSCQRSEREILVPDRLVRTDCEYKPGPDGIKREVPKRPEKCPGPPRAACEALRGTAATAAEHQVRPRARHRVDCPRPIYPRLIFSPSACICSRASAFPRASSTGWCVCLVLRRCLKLAVVSRCIPL